MKSFVLLILCGFLTLLPSGTRQIQQQTDKSLSKTSSLEISLIANEGFFIKSSDKKVLVDALFREGVAGYDTVPTELRNQIEQAVKPFDKIDLILASHYHADHFDATAVVAHLQSNPNALFVSTNQSIEKLKTTEQWQKIKDRATGIVPKEGDKKNITHNGIELTVFYLHHGRGRPIENLGLIFKIGGKNFLHIGDTEANADDFRQYNLVDEKIDLAFVPYWFLLGERSKASVREQIKAKHIVPMHMPLNSDLDDYVKKAGGWDVVLKNIKTEFPNAIIFRQINEKHLLD